MSECGGLQVSEWREFDCTCQKDFNDKGHYISIKTEVIEKAAYDSVCKERDEALAANNYAKEKLQHLENELNKSKEWQHQAEKLAEALGDCKQAFKHLDKFPDKQSNQAAKYSKQFCKEALAEFEKFKESND